MQQGLPFRSTGIEISIDGSPEQPQEEGHAGLRSQIGLPQPMATVDQHLACPVLMPACNVDPMKQFIHMGPAAGIGLAIPVVFDSGIPQATMQQSHVPPEWRGVHTVMVRNLPNRYTQSMLVEEICSSGFVGMFDFFYLPIDPETNANKGYAFMNFIDSSVSWHFTCSFAGKQMKLVNSKKIVSVCPAALQGFEANYAHYSSLRCSHGDPSARPLFYRKPPEAVMPQKLPRRGGQRRSTERSHRSLVDMAQESQRRWAEQADSTIKAIGPVRFCPWCGGPAQPTHSFCQFCGRSLRELQE